MESRPHRPLGHAQDLGDLLGLYAGELPVKPSAMETVRQILVQPKDTIMNAFGEHPLVANGAIVSAKSGSGPGVRWLVGHVRKGARTWIFVSCVTGAADLDQNAAIDLAAARLRSEHVL
jgi:beta-lactamase class D